MHRSGGGIVIDPIAVLTPDGVTVPDLAPGDGSAALTAAGNRSPDPLTAALDETISALAAAAHSGLSRPTAPVRSRIDATATALSRTGLVRAAGLLRAFLNALDGQSESGRTASWLEAQLHLLVSSELRAAES
ncbi:hypothetical protein LRD69_30290 [Streptomyces sp. JH14]|uniref:hypothetical protein n=1 Tax=Streptomyces sp. JH14 TaxID=2793630 RepID=UPI0023F6E0DE|nr:hypothetical protein [Streptomyces sp. JH14]MDF6046340.1 hypothetical protein [Streptomyces sp. JH14]